MSHIETMMLVALGFAVAALIGLFVARAVWSFAMRVGRRRLERSAPSALAELQAERDRLKAEYAMQGRRLTLRLDDLKTRLAEQMAEVSRNRNRIEMLAGEIEARDRLLAEREREQAEAGGLSAALQADLAMREAALEAARARSREQDEEVARLRQALAAAEAHGVERERAIASLHETRQGEIARVAAVSAVALSAHERLRRRIDDLTSLSRQIDEQRRGVMAELGTATPPATVAPAAETGEREAATPGDELERKIGEVERETQDLQAELDRLDSVWNSRLVELGLGRKPAGEAEAKPAAAAEAGPDEPEVATARSANIIPLASRIRALQKDLG